MAVITTRQPLFDVWGLVVRASRKFWVSLRENGFLVPARDPGAQLLLKAYPERVCLYHCGELIAHHGH